jgi:ribosomal protein S18 acetylase RimI-like enzyme
MRIAMTFRSPRSDELPALRAMVIDSFEPITWFKKLDGAFGPLNGKDWSARWEARMDAVFRSELLLVGEVEGEVVAFSSGTYDPATRLGFIDLIAVGLAHQRRGYGREMLRGMMEFLKGRGAEFVNLECLSDNDRANRLYESEGFTAVASSIRWFRRL